MSTTQLDHTDQLALLGDARLDDAAMTSLVRRITGDDEVHPYDVVAEPVDYPIGTPTTHALLRVHGSARGADGLTRGWSAFVKRVQSARWWNGLSMVPEQLRDDFIAQIPWRLEIAVHTSGLSGQLPPGLRLAGVYRIDETDDDRATVWMEDVEQSALPWDLGRFERAAYLLGRLAARRQPHLVDPLLPRPGITTPGIGLRYYHRGRVALGAVPVLSDDLTWHHPLLALAVCRNREHQLRGDLLALHRRVPGVLDALDRLPQTYQHGDASPQNLLVPAREPDTFVAIDWGFDCPQAVGFDLGQLMLGLGHAGELDPGTLREVHGVILPAFTEGLNADGMTVDIDRVRLGYLGSLLVRATFTALPLEAMNAPTTDELADLFDQRVRLTRFLVDLMRELDESVS